MRLKGQIKVNDILVGGVLWYLGFGIWGVKIFGIWDLGGKIIWDLGFGENIWDLGFEVDKF